MTGNNNHTALIPSEDITKEAGNRVSPKSARKGEPLLHMTDDMRRLSTPWAISMIRAQQIESFDLPAGVILDAAVGSGAQLIACLLYTSPSPRDGLLSRMPSSA